MKLNRKKLRKLILQELFLINDYRADKSPTYIKEGFMDYFKGMVGMDVRKPAMKGFNLGPSPHKFKLVTANELADRKILFLGSLVRTREAIGKSIESHFSDPRINIDLNQLRADIKADISGIDAKGYVHAPTDRDLALPGPIENPYGFNANLDVDYIGSPMRGWQLISSYLRGETSRLPVESRDLFAVQQAYAARQL